MNKYLVVIEETSTGFSAYLPDLPGCIGAGDSREAVEREIRAAVEFHVEGLREDGEPVPQPRTTATYVEVAA